MKSAVLRCAVWLLLLIPALGAHAQSTTASLEGRVLDQEGSPLPGANVIAIHEPTGSRYGAATNIDGRYRILGMRVGGPYTIRASFIGFQTVVQEDINLSLDQRRTLTFELAEQTAELGEVMVIGERDRVINQNRTGASANISQEEIEELPAISRSLTDYARLVPQAGGRGSNSFSGQNDRYNNLEIDGATLNDVFGLGDATPGSQAGAQPISIDAIKEFNVDIAPYDVRSSGFTGAQINAITKSGTNEWEGSVRYVTRTDEFTGNLDGVERSSDEFSRRYFVGTLGGPIIKDKLFFFLSGELKRESIPEATGVGGDSPDAFRFGESPLQEIQSIANDVYGYDPGGFAPFNLQEDNEKLLAKLDWNISESHKLTLRHNFVDARKGEGVSRGQDYFALRNAQYNFNSTQNSTVLQLNSTLGADMFNEFKAIYTRVRDSRDPLQDPFANVTVDLTGDGDDVYLGIDRFSQANQLDQDLFEISNDFTYMWNDHIFTVGTQNKFYAFRNLFIQDYYGSYTFEPFSVGDTDVSAVEAFRRGQPTEYRYSYATPLAPSNRPAAEFTAAQLGLYVQDEWQPNDQLKFTFGLRVDAPYMPESPTFNETAYAAFGYSTDQSASGNLLWSPRFGFNYSLGRERNETQFRGGVGIFTGRPPFVWISNQFSNTGADLFRLDENIDPEAAYADANGQYDPNSRFFPETAGDDPSDQPIPGDPGTGAISPINTTEVNLIDDDFRYPQILRASLGVDQELPFGFVATLEGLASRSINEILYKNINLEQVGETKYGRPLYGTPSSSRGNPNRVSPAFTNALLLTNSGDGYSYSVTGQIQRRRPTGLNGSLSYTYSQAFNVNNGTSSRAISNWQYNENKDVNNPRLGHADFEVRHKILTSLSYRFEYLDRFSTSIGIVLNSASGAPFSWIYDGSDANGDGVTNQDLVYVPETENDVFLMSENWDILDAFIESEDALDAARGEIIERNTGRAPWQNQLDLRINQEVYTLGNQKLELTLDVENVLNLIDDDWGRIRTTSFNALDAWSFEGYISEGDVGSRVLGRIVTTDDVGKPKISFNERMVEEKLNSERWRLLNFLSNWRFQLGARYTF